MKIKERPEEATSKWEDGGRRKGKGWKRKGCKGRKRIRSLYHAASLAFFVESLY